MSALTHPYRRVLPVVLIVAAMTATSAQTPIKPDNNKYTPEQDVQLGREAAQEARRQLPMLDDRRVDTYVETIGRDLVDAIPPEFQHRQFDYTFDVVNQAEINAFALPGGPMFLNRGMIEAAQTEGEVAGVMAHEISHVALRHGTAQATKAQKFQIGAIAGQILGAIVGGTAGSVIAQGSNFGLSAYFLKYGREYEREADLLGAQIMARAGYDPRQMANMFRTIEKQNRGSGGPEWLSSHPNPGNRYEAIHREAANLQIRNARRSDEEFSAVRGRLRSMPPAYTAEQIARGRANGGRVPRGEDDDLPTRASTRVEPPSGRYQTVRAGDLLSFQIPSNWEQSGGGASVTYAPDGAYYRSQSGSSGFTHGVQLGVIPNESHSLQQASDELIESLRDGNPDLRRQNGYTRETIAGRAALSTTLRNVSDVGRPELIGVSTLSLRDGSLLYLIAVSPQEEAGVYDAAFRRMKQTMRIRD
jgi:hypothetical protein